MISVIPLWWLMIVLPRWHQTKRIISSPLIAIGPAIIYALVVIQRLPDVLSAFSPSTIGSLQTLLSTPSGVVIIRAHFLAFDVFVGRWIYMDSRTHHLSPWLISMVILLMVILRDSRFEIPMRLACAAGTGLMIIGGVTGFMMLFNLGGVYQGNLMQNIQTVRQGDMLGTFTANVAGDAGGNLVVLHALGVHGLSVLSLLAWLLTYTTLSNRKQSTLATTGIVTYTGLLLLLAIAAFRTIPLSKLSYPLLAANGITGSLLLIVYGIALWRGIPALFYLFEQPAATRTAI